MFLKHVFMKINLQFFGVFTLIKNRKVNLKFFHASTWTKKETMNLRFCSIFTQLKNEMMKFIFSLESILSNFKISKIYFCSKLQTFHSSKKVLKISFEKVGLTRLNGYFRGAKTEIIRFLKIIRIIENEYVISEKRLISLTY